jgi:hypothetical protein
MCLFQIKNCICWWVNSTYVLYQNAWSNNKKIIKNAPAYCSAFTTTSLLLHLVSLTFIRMHFSSIFLVSWCFWGKKYGTCSPSFYHMSINGQIHTTKLSSRRFSYLGSCNRLIFVLAYVSLHTWNELSRRVIVFHCRE